MKIERIVDEDGAVRFYNENGQLHREDGPAVEYCKSKHGGGNRWFYNGQKHRIGGPAVTHEDGTTEWWEHGARHRIDGMAIENSQGGGRWFYRGKFVECENQEEFERLVNLKAFW
jgi:hypothetical protein